VWICVENRLPGHALESGDAEERQRITKDAGELVARLHTIKIEGFGYLRPDGSAPAPSWTAVMLSEQSDDALAATEGRAVACGVPGAWVRIASETLHRHREMYDSMPSALLHGDLSSAHVLTDGAAVTGLIDFEQAFAGDPTFEFVRWNYFRTDCPLDWLLEGYRRVADPGADLDLRIRLGRLRLHLALIDFHSANDHAIARRRVGQLFAEDAAWFGFDGV
jgi:aminoglycoside phosphotransferase (APT) family kinase protein